MASYDDKKYDMSASTTKTQSGFSFDQRKKLEGDAYQKFHERAVKSNIEDKFSKALAVTSFDPKELAKANNFVQAISTTRSKLNKMKSHFVLQGIGETFEVMGVYYDPGSESHKVAKLSASLLDDFTKFSLEQVRKSVEVHVIFSVEDSVIHAQNNSIAYQYIMNSCDPDLQSHIEDCLSRYEEDHFRYSGVLAFHIMISSIYKHTQDTGLKLEVTLTELRLSMFPGEDVAKAVATIRAIKSFLSISDTQYRKKVFNVLTGGSHQRLQDYLLILDDTADARVSTAEKIMSTAQEKYVDLIQDGKYLRSGKEPASFKSALQGTPNANPLTINPKVKSGSESQANNLAGARDSQGRYIYDRKGRKIDYEPPKQGEPSVRNVNGREEKFCTKCKFPRWGFHGDAEHEEWIKTTRSYRFSQTRRQQNGDPSPPGATTTASNPSPSGRAAAFIPSANYFCNEVGTGIDF